MRYKIGEIFINFDLTENLDNLELVKPTETKRKYKKHKKRKKYRKRHSGFRRWTASEDQFILRNFERMNAEELAEKLLRTPNATRSRIKTLRSEGMKIPFKHRGPKRKYI